MLCEDSDSPESTADTNDVITNNTHGPGSDFASALSLRQVQIQVSCAIGLGKLPTVGIFIKMFS